MGKFDKEWDEAERELVQDYIARLSFKQKVNFYAKVTWKFVLHTLHIKKGY